MEIPRKLEIAGKKFRLTRRELEVLSALSHGAKWSAAADDLGISISTVQFHIRSILRKTRCVNSVASIFRLLL